jgi:hypothetical protein
LDPASRAFFGFQFSPFRFSPRDWFVLFVGLFLGLTLLKFGNPVILESSITAPRNLSEFRLYSWPPGWSVWLLIPVALIGCVLFFQSPVQWPASKWLWILPLIWYGWQWVSSLHTVDSTLTSATLRHFSGLLACYGLGAMVLGDERSLRLLMVGLLAAFAFCLVRAVDQKLIEFPEERRFLIESERMGWTNLPPELILEFKQSQTIITTNGVDIANPVILQKYEHGRAFGTLVYPNALAGVVLMLFPVAMTLAVNGTRKFRLLTRVAAIALTGFLGLGALFWSGSKSGWLIAMIIAGIWLFRLGWPTRLKWIALILVTLVGAGVFTVRFQNYFAAGATSVGARIDYWRAAVETTAAHPIIGTGPGTFQRPYERIKAPEAEMARLIHNDYLEQFSDSGLIGGIAYVVWILGLLLVLGRRVWARNDPFGVAIFLGLAGWFIQGLTEFSLYVPALAWTAFLLAGSLLGIQGKSIQGNHIQGNQIDNPSARR